MIKVYLSGNMLHIVAGGYDNSYPNETVGYTTKDGSDDIAFYNRKKESYLKNQDGKSIKASFADFVDEVDAPLGATKGLVIDALDSLLNFDLGGGVAVDWGDIGGDIANQTDLQNALSDVETSANTYADSLVVGLWDDRGSFNASANTFPATGGSGTAGAILKGDIWTISVAGVLGGVAVGIGDTVRALVDSPAQTASNWDVLENNIGYVPENVANKDQANGYLGANANGKLPPAKLEQDTTNRLVTDAEKATWNSKANGTHTHSIADVSTLQTVLDGKQNVPTQGLNALAQTAAIGTTTIFTAVTAGMYMVNLYGSVQTTGNRNVTAQTIVHTEGALARTKSVGAGVNTNNANNYSSLDVLLFCDAGTTITYSNTMSGATGSYNVRIGIEKLW